MEPPRARVSHVQFGIMSPDDIERMSVTEVREVGINKSGTPRRAGVNDPALGTTVVSMLCSTCGCSSTECPGHFGHIDLAQPVANVEFLSQIQKVLTCVCFNCSHLLMTSAQRRAVTTVRNMRKRMNEAYAQCRKQRMCTACRTAQPTYVKDDASVRVVFALDDDAHAGVLEGAAPPKATPRKLVQILRHIARDDVPVLGMDPDKSHPSSMMLTKLPVPPVAIRPSHSRTQNMRVENEDDLTFRLRGIVKLNNQHAGAGEVNLAKFTHDGDMYRNADHLLDAVVDAKNKTALVTYLELQRATAAYQDRKFQTKSDNDYGRNRNSVRDRFAGKDSKKARLRGTLCGKRQDYSARTVITPCTRMRIDQVGVPVSICMKLTYPERVTQFNIRWLTAAVRNGPERYPGANYVQDASGNSRSLGTIDRERVVLKYGWTVLRHLVDGDDVLFNRQPSLHKMSLMCHRVLPVPGKTFRLHMAVTGPYNADFDGDEMNMNVLLNPLARAEGRELMSVRRNMVKDGTTLVCFQQHAVLGAYLLTDPGTSLSVREAQQLLYQNPHLDDYYDAHVSRGDLDPRDDGRISGRQALSACLPPDLNVPLMVVRGRMLDGPRLDKAALNNRLLYVIWKDFGAEAAARFLEGVQAVFEHHLGARGLTVNAYDCQAVLPPDVLGKLGVAQRYADGFPDHTPSARGRAADATETNVCLVMDKARDVVGECVLRDLAARTRSGLYEMVDSRAKGSTPNLVQIMGAVGQQRDHRSMRMPQPTTHFNGTDDKAAAHGMITSNFFGGLGPLEFYAHLVSARGGLVDTSVKTSDTGYSQRCISKAMEDITVDIRGTVRDVSGRSVQQLYGDDGLDAQYLEVVPLRVCSMTSMQVMCAYRCVPNASLLAPAAAKRWDPRRSGWKAEVRRLLGLRARLGAALRCTGYACDVPCPVNYARALDRYPPRAGLATLTPGDVQDALDMFWANLERVMPLTLKLELAFRDWCGTRALWGRLDADGLHSFLKSVHDGFARARAVQGESVGMLASQNSGQPLTQMTLSSFHHTGRASHLVSGVARMMEIINLAKTPATPSMTVFPRAGCDPTECGQLLTHVSAAALVTGWTSAVPARAKEFMRRFERWDRCDARHVVLNMDKARAIELRVTPRQLCNALMASSETWLLRSKAKVPNDLHSAFSYAALDSDEWWVCASVAPGDTMWNLCKGAVLKHACGEPASDAMVGIQLADKLTQNCSVRGVPRVDDFYLVQRPTVEVGDTIRMCDTTVLCTKGTNLLGTLRLPFVDPERTVSNHIREVCDVFGIDAACSLIEHEWAGVMRTNNAHVAVRHITLIAETMCYSGVVCPMSYTGICNEAASVIKKATFERAMDAFVWGAAQGRIDEARGAMDSMCWNSGLRAGTGSVVLYHEPVDVPRHVSDHNTRRLRTQRVEYVPMQDLSQFRVPAAVVGKRKAPPETALRFARPSARFRPTSPVANRSVIMAPTGKRFKPWSP
jgi:DNA-directed RNA polymerase II subunit RPB1